MNTLETLKQLLGEAAVIDGQSAQATPYLEESRKRQAGQALAVVLPQSTYHVQEIVRLAHGQRLPIVPQGGNTGRVLGALATDSRALVVNLSRLNRLRKIDTTNQSMIVEAGMTLYDVQQAADAADLFFPLSLGSAGSCQIGGNLATNAGGMNVLRYGNTRDLVFAVEAVLASGELVSGLHTLRKNNTGYDLKDLLIGSEGTLGIITAAALKLFPKERAEVSGVLAFADLPALLVAFEKMREKLAPFLVTFELIPALAWRLIAEKTTLRLPLMTDAPYYVWYRLASPDAEDDARLHATNEVLLCQFTGLVDAVVAQNAAQAAHFVALREAVVTVQQAFSAMLKFDIAVPLSAIERLFAEVALRLPQVDDAVQVYAFGHVGDGNMHFNLAAGEQQPVAAFLEKKARLEMLIYDIVASLGGTFSAEHGVGAQKIELLKQYQDEGSFAMMQTIKQALDPLGLMNPGKLF